MNVRGIDDDGNVANFVETEQIMVINELQHSYIITRGSVPIFWSQHKSGKSNMYEDVTINRSTDMTKIAFNKHFNSMIQDFNKVHIIDLLQDEREREQKLTKEYYKLFFESD